MINFREIPMSEELHKLLDDIQVGYVFQPIFEAKSLKLFAYEALMRPQGMTPLELIEKLKAQKKLHLVELITVFGAFKGYHDRGYECAISINSFPEDCMSDEEEELLHTCFPDMGRRMIVEILEYTDLDFDKWTTKKNQIKRRNIRTSLDDFGTGSNSSMGVVDTFEPTYIKLDRSLIMDVHKSIEKQKIVREYVQEFHKRGIKVLAEGIEKKEEMDTVVECGIDLLQGYYLGKPQ